MNEKKNRPGRARNADVQPKLTSGIALPKRGPVKGRRALYRILPKKGAFFIA
jgi:hypothetical protein